MEELSPGVAGTEESSAVKREIGLRFERGRGWSEQRAEIGSD